MTTRTQIVGLVAVCGTAGTVLAQPQVVTGSGATLQESFFINEASTNDFIGTWDGDAQAGVFGSFFPDQLAPGGTASLVQSPWTPTTELLFHYRLVGSGNGLLELDTFGARFDQTPDNTDLSGNPTSDPGSFPGNSAFADDALYNRFPLVAAGVLATPPGDSDHRSGMVDVPNGDNDFRAQKLDTMDPDNGFYVDFGSSDTPASWFAIQGGTPRPDATPSSSGYGNNPALALNKDGSQTTQTNLLRPFNRLNTDQVTPDGLTVYETPISITPVAALVNYGVGMSEIYMSDLRHLNASGRRKVGENLMCVTRDSGSGTRNAFMNGIALDPSWGKGENIGDRVTTSPFDLPGPNHQPSNKGGSSRMDATVIQTRLGTGHTGAERLIVANRAYILDEEMNCFGVVADLKGGTVAARPTQANVLTGDANGYNIVGPATFSHVGDPRNAAPEDGGWGWRNLPAVVAELGAPLPAEDESGPTPFVDGAGIANPTPPNQGFSRYLNNITRSIDEFVAVPGGATSEFMPGELLATQFLLVAAPDNVPENPPSSATQPIPIVTNASQNAAVRLEAANDTSAELASPLMATFDFGTAGRAPTRTGGEVYSDDALTGSSQYINQGGAFVAYGSILNLRNRVCGDFNGDGARSAADAADMMAAYVQRQGGAAWTAPNASGAGLDTDGDGVADIPASSAPGSAAIIEVLGDYNADGSFDAEDIRYWADGLVLVDNGLDVIPVTPDGMGGFTVGDGTTDATLDRAAGYSAVDDNTAGGNFFGTTLATGAAYQSGDSRADIAGSGGFTPGYTPIGHDLVVDAQDIDYVKANTGDWCDLETAATIDLSADMNGDLVVDDEDIRVVVEDILETNFGDVDLDGDVDGDDEAIVIANQGLTGAGWADGDTDCDGDVDADDLAVFNGACRCDVEGDGDLDPDDIAAFVNNFIDGVTGNADIDGDGDEDPDDIAAFVSCFTANPAEPGCDF